LSTDQTAEIAASKQVVYDGFKSTLQAGVGKEKAGILVDEQFGAAVADATKLAALSWAGERMNRRCGSG
jgi:5-dehydro-2-deoxygluconokinase